MNGRTLPVAVLLVSVAFAPTHAAARREIVTSQEGPVGAHRVSGAGQAGPGPGQAAPGPGQAVPGPARPGSPQTPSTGPRDNVQRPDAGTARIAGRVIGGENGSPLRRAVVDLGGEGLREGRSTTTDEAGRFEFSELPAGRFHLRASKAGYVTMQYGQRRPGESGRPLDIADGQRVDNVQFNLLRGGVITGRITDEFGEPVAGMTVQVQRHRYVEGRRQLVPVASGHAVTDDLGRYRAYGLSPGEYFVSARQSGAGGGFGSQTDARAGFAPTFYPGTPSESDAQRVRVTVGAEVAANFALTSARLLRVSGTAVDSDGKPIANSAIMVQEGSPGRRGAFFMNVGGMIQSDGTFRLTLPPGDYVLHLNKSDRMSPDETENAAVPLTLSSEDVSGVTIVTARPAKLAGQIVVDGAQGAALKPTDVHLWATPVDPVSRMFGPPFKTNDDWTFEGTAQDSPVLLRAGVQQSDWQLKAVLQRGVDVTDTGVVFRTSEVVDDLQVVLSNRISVVTGAVMSDGGAAAKEYAALIYADDPNRWGPMTRFVRSARPDQQGQFQVKGLPPGNYIAVALPYLEDGQEGEPEFLQQLRQYGTSLQIGEGERKAVNLRIVPER